MAVELSSDQQASADQYSQSSEHRKATKPEKGYDTETGLGGPSASRDNSDASLAVGKQIAMEAGNDIRYRTCSWPKVRTAGKRAKYMLIASKDGRAAVRRVHLFGYHVFPMVLLDPWSCPGPHPDRRRCRIGALYLLDHLGVLLAPPGDSRCLRFGQNDLLGFGRRLLPDGSHVHLEQ